MKTTWLHKNNSKKIVFVCNGWGMDEYPFRPVTSQDYDVFLIYDYRNLNKEHDFKTLVQDYDQSVLLGWSMGVWVGHYLFKGCCDIFTNRIAVNGTLCPINDRYGIPEDAYEDTYLHFDDNSQLTFYRRMCRDKKIVEKFLANQPRRTVDDQKEELVKLHEKTECADVAESIFETICIAKKDLIIPTANQVEFWKKGRVRIFSTTHFPFYRWQTWDQIILELTT